MATPAHAVFRCVDEKGVTHYGDTMPPQCAKKEVTEMNRGGSVVRKIDAQLTPEQIKIREVEKAKRIENLRLVAEQKQRDLALLGTYGSEREFAASQSRDVTQLDARIKTLQSRTEDLDALVKKRTDEMEFYKAGQSRGSKVAKVREAPQQLVNALARSQSDRAALDTEIAQSEEEKKAVVARHEEEITRWKRLKAGLAVGTILDADGNVIITPNGERKPPPVSPATVPATTSAATPVKAPAKK